MRPSSAGPGLLAQAQALVQAQAQTLALASEATTVAETQRDKAAQGRLLLAASLAAATDENAALQSKNDALQTKAAALQALLEQERVSGSASKLELSAALAAGREHAAALAALEAERESERTVHAKLQAELQAELANARRQADKLDGELWCNAEQLVSAGSRLGELQHELAEQRELCQKAQAALAAARARLATPPPLLPLEAELQREAQELRWTEAHSPGMRLSRCSTPPSPPRCATTPRATTGSRAKPPACVGAPSPTHGHDEPPPAPAISGHLPPSPAISGQHAELASPSSVMVALKRLEMAGDDGRCSGPAVLPPSPPS